MYISLDRWIAVDFRAYYKIHATQLKVILVIGATFCYFLTFYLPIFIVFGDQFLIFCDRMGGFAYSATWYQAYQAINLPLTLTVVVVSQSRLMFLALRAKLRLYRKRKLLPVLPGEFVVEEGIPTESEVDQFRARKLLRTMTKTVLAGSVMVIVAVIFQLPAWALSVAGKTKTPYFTAAVIMFFIEHTTHVLVNFVFSPHFRKTARSLFMPTRNRINTRNGTGTSANN